MRRASRILAAIGIGLAIVVWLVRLPADGNPADLATHCGIDMGDMYDGWRLGAPDACQYAPVYAQLLAVVSARRCATAIFARAWFTDGSRRRAAGAGVILRSVEDLCD
jgi:hypothetical protein